MDFNTLLDEVYEQLGTNKKETIILPNIILEKDTTRVIWKNIKEFLKIRDISANHFYNFISYKIKDNINWVSDHKSDGLIIHNKKISDEDIKDVMKKYVKEYLICKICNKSDTTMEKDKSIRANKIKCNNCKSEYTINDN